ncbi:hypothetical protein EVAR_93909_1 [Eumeta japonica]|uniref:Uncharacterized protein n=1 Tax=Eumeta variegata TaxID=151549 RepID=A0A4C1TP26_EUMVA|nr:hypothetical protein EVAR_93909_1 [Eumeta japonica]
MQMSGRRPRARRIHYRPEVNVVYRQLAYALKAIGLLPSLGQGFEIGPPANRPKCIKLMSRMKPYLCQARERLEPDFKRGIGDEGRRRPRRGTGPLNRNGASALRAART